MKKINRTPFEFDGGVVRFTIAGQIVANIMRIAFWLAVIAGAVATLVLLGIEIGLWYMTGGIR